MNSKKHISTFETTLAIIPYYYLPRIKMVTLPTNWNLFFDLRNISVIMITFQNEYSNKWKNVNLSQMVVSSYSLFLLTTLFYFIALEFI
jgi:hypothetical protein